MRWARAKSPEAEKRHRESKQQSDDSRTARSQPVAPPRSLDKMGEARGGEDMTRRRDDEMMTPR